MKLLKNIFVSTRFNKVELVDIYFDEKIEKIEEISDELDWSDINKKEKLTRIKQVFKNHEHAEADEVIDGDFKLALPGGIDPHVHFNTPGFENREDFGTGSKSAIAGGTTTIFDMPCTSIPPIISRENFAKKEKAVADMAYTDYKFWGGISGDSFSDINKLKNDVAELTEEAVGFKVYTVSGMSSFKDLTYEQIKSAAEIVKEQGSILAVHAEDKKLVNDREKFAKLNLKNDWGAYCGSRDDQAEAKAVHNLIKIASATGCHIHIVHLSSQLGLGLIRKARSQGVNITTETCPHYLYFTQIDFDNPQISNYLKTAPPVKFEYDREALWEGLSDGTIGFITTDHAGCDPLREKRSKDFWEVYGGIPGVQHRVNFLISEGFLKNRIDLSRTVELLSGEAANIFSLKNKGMLIKGYDADICLIDLYNETEIKSSDMLSKGKYTPFEGVLFGSKITDTFLRGNQIYSLNKENSNNQLGKLLKE